MSSYDVVVIGCGPAGLMALRELEGLRVICIDKKAEVGLPLRCGEGIKQREMVDLFGEDVGRQPWIRNAVDHHKIVVGKASRTLNVPYFELDRPRWEQWLAEPVRDRIRLGVTCKDIRIEKDGVRVLTENGTYDCRMVFLAYGPQYRYQARYGLCQENPQHFLACYGGVYSNVSADTNSFSFITDPDIAGSLWVFPKSETEANIGFGAIDGSPIRSTFERLMKRFPEFQNGSRTLQYGGVVPVSGPISKTYADRMLILGDAAGFVYAGTGEGICYALQSGKIAAQVAKEALAANRFDAGFMKTYEKKWKAKFGKDLRAGKIFLELMEMAYRFDILEQIFVSPSHTDEEIAQMILTGDFPLRTKIAYNFARLLGYTKGPLERRELSKFYINVYRFIRLFKPNGQPKAEVTEGSRPQG